MPRFAGKAVEEPKKSRFAGKLVEQPAEEKPSGDLSANNVVRSFATGVPIIGGALNKMNAATNAALAPLVNPLLPDDLDLKGDTWSERYERSLAEQEGMDEAFAEKHPYVDTGLQIGGAVAGTVPMVMAAPAAFGAGGGGLGARTIASTLSGGAVGGADSAVRSEGDIDATMKGAGWGFGTGFVAPGLAAVFGKGWQGFRNMRANRAAAKESGMDSAVLSALNRDMRRDAIPADEIQKRLAALGPEGMLADLGPNLRDKAGAIVATQGPGKNIVREAIEARDADANWRIRSALTDTLGPDPVPSRVIEGIGRNQDNLGPAYREVFRNARPADTRPIAQYLDSQVQALRGDAQREVREVRKMLNQVGKQELETNPSVLHETRMAIDGKMKKIVDPNALRALQNARLAIDDALRETVPNIKEVDARYHELGKQEDAIQRGQTVLAGGREAPRPPELAREVSEGALPDGMMVGPSAAPFRLRQGARAELERLVGTKANDRVALAKAIGGEGDWNRARLSTLFGPDKARRIMDLLDAEKAFYETSQEVIRNSKTAARTAAQAEVGGPNVPKFGGRESYMAGGMLGALRAGGVKGAEAIMEALAQGRTEAINTGLAKALTDRNPLAIMQALEKSSMAKQVDRASLERVARALMIGGGTAAARP